MSNKITQTTTPIDKQEGQMGKWAPYYDLTMALITCGREKKLRQMTIKLSQIMPGDNVLEIGCGTGTLTLAAKAQVGSSGEVAGIDIAPEMVTQARHKATRKGLDVYLQEGSITSIPFPENRFDVVICSFMIFHMPEDVRRKGFIEIYRVLRSGGHLFILDSVSLDELAPVLKEDSFTEIEIGKTKFIYMGIWYLRGKVEKIRNESTK
jgi:ubiquinone/menaquinone biosynthesis C-methylase UbiE